MADIITSADASDFPFFTYFLLALVGIRLITIYIDLRQLNEFKKQMIDPYLTDFFEQKEFEDSQKYNAEKKKFSIFHKIVDTGIDFALWFLFFYVGIWNWMERIMSSFGLCSDTDWINDFI